MKLCLALLFGLFASVAVAKEQTLRLGTEGAYPPFNQTATDGSVTGFDIDIGNALCAEMKAACNWIIQDWDGMIPALLANKFDAIVASMSITAERKEKVNFTNRYYSTPLGLLVPKGSSLRAMASSLEGKRIGVQRGTIADTFATKFWGKVGVKVVRYADQEQADADLVSGRLDAGLQDALVADGGFLQTPEGQNYEFGGELITGSTAAERSVIGEGVGIALRKRDTALLQRFNQALAAIIKNGTYTKIRKKYFAYDIY